MRTEQEKVKNRIRDIKHMLNNNRVVVDDEWIEFCNELRKELKQLEETA